MQLHWSHALLYVRDKKRMVEFYTRVLGFQVTDRGNFGDDGTEAIFMSQDPQEHHQLAMVDVRKGDDRSNSVNHFAFRVDSLDDVLALNKSLRENEGIETDPISHGNTLSIYFEDPEGNGIEVFWKTPWHVGQPMLRSWDPNMDKEQALAWVETEFKKERGFGPIADYEKKRMRELSNS